MDSVGIIAEYNPFHNGHEYHIRRAKERSGAKNAIIAMSASFVQRGEPACIDKFIRAKHALLCGADMVIELPDLLSCACAERFAYGGVRLLAGTRLVGSIAFGSESGDIEKLKLAAGIKLYGADIKAGLLGGLSYPKAAAEALKKCGVTLDSSSPNDMLALEYLRQLSRLTIHIEPIAIRREGAGYNSSTTETEYASASALRSASSDIGCGYDTLKRHIPAAVFNELIELGEEGRFPAAFERLSPAILYKLRSMGRDAIAELADVSEGLENPIYRAALTSSSCSELLEKVKTKRYTLARLKRILIYSLIGTTAELQRLAFDREDALYIRVLGIRKSKLHMLSELAEKAKLPVIVTASDIERLPKNARRVLEHTRRASLIHALAFPDNRACAEDFSHPLITV